MILEKERELIVEYGKKLLKNNLTTGTGGNLSILNRDQNLLAISPSGVDYYQITKEDIVILDLMMPEKDGLETISILRSIVPDLKIIVYTAFGRYENSLYAKEADRFLLKTESPERVLKSIKDLLE